MIWALLLFVVSILLSSFFSGSETGFYRATRVRLTMDALAGSWVARGLIWLTNNPALFVATTLVGNNLANFLTSHAVVMMARQMLGTSNYVVELLGPIALTPFVFVYGELLPKQLFYAAPNRLLRWGGPFFLGFAVLFLPVSAILWMLGRALRYLSGEAPEQLQVSLARTELQRVLDEGQEVGVLRPAQRQLAQGMFLLAGKPLSTFCVPMARVVSVPLGSPKADVFRLAKRQANPFILVSERRGKRILGYVRILDLYLSESELVDEFNAIPEIVNTEPPLSALIHLRSQKQDLARVVDEAGKTTGIVTTATLSGRAWAGA
ncbi:MAG: DUF21 domain-containing protein [Planctomycetales bacterium]|nr:DUF21 domain-containing protein [Planctomycetales bacterium]